MESLHLEPKRTLQRAGTFAATVLLTALPVAAFAQSMGSDDPVGKPFALWIFLVPIAGIMAAITAFAAKSAVEKPGR